MHDTSFAATTSTSCDRVEVRTHNRPDERIPIEELWARLVTGDLQIRSAWHTSARCFVAVSRTATRREVPAIGWFTAQRVLCGDQPKVIAADLSIAQSTVCAYRKAVVASLCDASAMPAAVAFLVVCACSSRSSYIGPASLHGTDEQGNPIVSVGLWDGRLKDAGLSTAEWDIVRLVAHGKASLEICAHRNTSPRTIANQLNAIYRKLGISGRRELVVAALVRF